MFICVDAEIFCPLYFLLLRRVLRAVDGESFRVPIGGQTPKGKDFRLSERCFSRIVLEIGFAEGVEWFPNFLFSPEKALAKESTLMPRFAAPEAGHRHGRQRFVPWRKSLFTLCIIFSYNRF